MTMQNLKDFIQDLFTLRTVWIDKGYGQWAVKKRFHPLLRSMCWTLALIVCAGIYSSVKSIPESEAEAKPEMIAAKPPERIMTLPDPDPVPEPAPAPKEIIVPLKTAARKTKTEIILPSERNPGTDRIITPVTPTQPIKTAKNDNRYRIQVNKSEYTLTLYKGNDPVKTYDIAVGKNPGDKQRVGDNRTPTGDFKIVSIENASSWSHDFRDGKGKIAGAYGPWFLRLDAKGWKGIGIHGTHDPNSLRTKATEGCIRLSNNDIAELKQYAYRNMPVSIREY